MIIWEIIVYDKGDLKMKITRSQDKHHTTMYETPQQMELQLPDVKDPNARKIEQKIQTIGKVQILRQS